MHPEKQPEIDHGSGAPPPHLALWLDHSHARLIWLYRDRWVATQVRCPDPGAKGHVHHHSGTPGSGHAGLEPAYLEKISEAIGAAEEILILGPVEARSALKSFLQRHKRDQSRHVLGDEALAQDEPGAIAQRARSFFRHADLMKDQRE